MLLSSQIRFASERDDVEAIPQNHVKLPSAPQRTDAGRAADINRVAILHSRLSGYLSACWHALKERADVELLVMRYPAAENAPFSDRHFTWIDHLCDGRSLSRQEIQDKVNRFDPDVLLVSGWFDRNYLAVARHLRSQGVPVIAGCDAQWTGSVRQQLGRLVAPWYLHTAIDVMWVAGERQRQLAERFGYTSARCWEGYYACDWKRFAEVYEPARARPKAFLFVGRYIPMKGLDSLISAYRQYRSMAKDPWSLVCAGAGELSSLLQETPGAVNKGFVQPDELPGLMRDGGVFVLPSRREPWGVVVQEAAAAGLPILCSTASGAGVHLVQHGYNGFTFEPEDVDHLALLMMRMSSLDVERRGAMGQASHRLSKQFTPQRWAHTLVQGLAHWKERIHAEIEYVEVND